MKKLLIMTCVAAAMAASAADRIAYWDFSSDAEHIADVSGNCNDLRNGGITFTDGAAFFNGIAKVFSTRRFVALSATKAYTIECFVKSPTRHGGMIMELSANYYNTGAGHFMLYTEDGVAVRTSNGYRQRNLTTDIFDNEWHHMAIIVNPKGSTQEDQLQFYVDKTLQTSSVGDGTGMALSANCLYIGSRGDRQYPFNGQIDDVRITEGVLSPSEFLQTRSAGDIDVRAYWKFDDANALSDSSGNGNTLQGSQGVTFANGCASFNGTASNVRTANTLDLSAYKDVTVEFFIRKHVGVDTVGMVLEHSQNGANYSEGFYLDLGESGTGAIRGLFRFGNAHCYGDSPTYSVNTGWHHLALVKDSSNSGNNSCISLYVDGVRITSYTMNTKWSDNLLRNDYLYIGSRKNSQYFLNADIDDVRITAAVLQPGQFLRTRTGPLDDVIAYWPFDATNMLADATGNGNLLTGSGVTVNDNGAAVFNGSQSGFATLAPLPLYAYDSMTVEWFMKSSMSDLGMVLETTANYDIYPGAFYAAANEFAGYSTLLWNNVLSGWSVMDGRWHHYALVYDWNETTSDIVRVYRDGVKVATHASSDVCAVKPRTGALFIGARNGSQYPFVGQLDDIKITGRVLTPAEFMTKRSKPQRGIVISFQ